MRTETSLANHMEGGRRAFPHIVWRAPKSFKVEAIGNKLQNFVSGTKTLYVTCSHTNWCVGGGAASGQSWQFEAISLHVLTKDSAVSPLVKHFAQPLVNYSRRLSYVRYPFQSLSPLSCFIQIWLKLGLISFSSVSLMTLHSDTSKYRLHK